MHNQTTNHRPGFRMAVLALGSIIFLTTLSSDNAAQDRSSRHRNTPPPQDLPTASDGTVNINYPDTVSLSAFIDYVSQSLEIKIIYGDEIKNQTVVFRPGEIDIPRGQLLDLLRSMLRMRDLAMVEADIEGWFRIIATDDMQRFIGEIRKEALPAEVGKSNQVVTQVVPIASADMQAVVAHAKSFLSSPKASVIEIPDKKLILITDYESAVAKAVEIIKLIDVAPVSTQIVTVPVKNYDAKTIAAQVLQVLKEKATLEGLKGPRVTVQPDLSSGSILLIGSDEDIAQAQSLIERFDIVTAEFRTTESYAPQHISVDRLKTLIESVVAAGLKEQGALKLFIDQEANRLYVTGAPELHAQIRSILEAEDLAAPETSRPLRIYKPRNRVASELINVLAEVLPNVTATANEEPVAAADRTGTIPPGPNRPPGEAGPGQVPPMPPAQERIEKPITRSKQINRIEGQDFTLAYDEKINAIIAIGTREFHTRLQGLLAELDKRPAQVLIEMTLVAVTFNDSFSLGVELANEERPNPYQTLVFSSFGLSGIDLGSGMRTFNPGGGFNGVIMGPYETPIVLRAIAAHGNSKIITTPKVIVSDSTTGSIRSVEESPFTSVNASQTVATTSFAGFESAGTTLTVTPRIAQGDHLSLDYNLNFSNFTGQAAGGVPPPRTTNSFSGTVEIPDGYTIVVGGLVTDNESDSVTEVPLAGRIPVLGVLFQNSNRTRTKFRVYAFIRPLILRDDQFADLKMVSQRELDKAEIANQDFPDSQLLWMR